MQAGYTGLAHAGDELGVTVTYKDHVRPKPEDISATLMELIAGQLHIVIARGGQNSAAAKTVADAMIGDGADILFTMLNSGRTEPVDACRAHAVKQIGNVVDWTEVDPDVVIASTCADAGMAVFDAVKDFVDGSFKRGSSDAW